MTRAVRILFTTLAVVAAAVPLPAIAQQKPGASPQDRQDRPSLPSDSSPSNEPKTKEQLEAQQHFQRAKDLYQTGSYREAIAELEAARVLDPKGKDLVFNLGIVHEKLGKFDEAIAFFRHYMDMESVTAAERVKAENIIKRIEGAKREVPPTPTARGTATSPEPVRPPEDTRRGRIDAATITAGSVAIVGLGVGTVFGILALSNRPSDFVTGRDGSYEKLQTQSDDAHAQAVVADIGFGVGIVASILTAYLYFGRTAQEPKRTALTRVLPSAAPVASGGVFLLGGSFR
jgi:tetratricopeptide (TPR) repeat protein